MQSVLHESDGSQFDQVPSSSLHAHAPHANVTFEEQALTEAFGRLQTVRTVTANVRMVNFKMLGIYISLLHGDNIPETPPCQGIITIV